jgi:pyrroline-5-carboxylate reductase
VAAQLARATVAGAGELLHRSELPAAQLRKNVTSPNGTTAAALDVLMGEGGLGPLMAKAVAAAARRSRELSG